MAGSFICGRNQSIWRKLQTCRKLYHIMLYLVHIAWVGFKLMVVVIGTNPTTIRSQPRQPPIRIWLLLEYQTFMMIIPASLLLHFSSQIKTIPDGILNILFCISGSRKRKYSSDSSSISHKKMRITDSPEKEVYYIYHFLFHLHIFFISSTGTCIWQ